MKEIIKNKIEEISVHLLSSYENEKSDSLHNGKIGNALFFFYASRFFQDKKLEQAGLLILEDVIQNLHVHPMRLGLSEGLTGVLWFVKHLTKYGFIHADYRRIYRDIEGEIYTQTAKLLESDELDFLHGALGNIYYLIYDLENHPENKLCAENIFCSLSQKIKSTNNGENWMHFYKNYFDLGSAHGISALLLILNKFIEQGIKSEDALTDVNKIINLIMSYYKPGNILACFPSSIKNGTANYRNRFTWCNGILGIVYSLFRVVNTIKNPLETDITSLAKNASLINDYNSCGLIDSCLCHGTAGNFHVFNRLGNRYGNDEFLKVKDIWLYKTMEFASFKDGVAGFKTWDGNDFVVNNTLLSGVSGIGLALISYLDEELMHWDESFLL